MTSLLQSTSVIKKTPVYFRNEEPPVVSHEYTSTVAMKVFNFASVSTLSNLNVAN